jgi:hypothetical protein
MQRRNNSKIGLSRIAISIVYFVVAIVCVGQSAVSAISPEERLRKIYNGITFVDDLCFYDASAADAAAAASTGDNMLDAMAYFVEQGLTPIQAAGIVGNLHAESGILPARQEGEPPDYIATKPINGIGFGIAQWTYTSRQAPLEAKAVKKGVAVNTLRVQLEYVWDELQARGSILADLRASTDIRTATNIILQRYEVPRDRGESVISYRTSIASRDLARFEENGSIGANNDASSCNTGGSLAGENCASIGKTSASKDDNPYICENQDMKCAAGTDAGVGAGYADGTKYDIRLCMVQGLKVNAFIAGKVDALINQSKEAPPSGLGSALGGGSFRTMQQQTTLWYSANCDSGRCSWPVADPGYSNHQMGLAIDFSGIAQRDPRNPKFLWLKANASKYGLINLPSESWHWSVDGD